MEFKVHNNLARPTVLPMRAGAVAVGDLPAPSNCSATAGDNEGDIYLSCDPVTAAGSSWDFRVHQDGTD